MFYAPTPLVLAMLGGAALLFLYLRQRRLAATFAALLLPPLLVMGLLENHVDNRQQDSAQELRLVHWNVYGCKLGLSNVQDKLLSLDADLIVLSETPNDFPRLNGYQAFQVENLVVLSKYALSEPVNLSQQDERLYACRWRSPQGDLVILFADLPSSIGRPRDPMLSRLTTTLQQRNAALLVGDLNAPRRSLALNPLPSGYRHAYDSAGSGWSYTWPSFLPMFAIDQCIHSTKITPLRYRLETAWSSDHRIQVFDFKLASER